MNTSELLFYFTTNFPHLVEDMQDANHSVLTEKPNNFHLEGSVWTHSMMVLKQSEINSNNIVNNISALLHDLGKPLSRDIH